MTFTADQRRRLLSEYFSLEQGLVDLEWLQNRGGEPGDERLVRHERIYTARVSELWDEYIAGLPVLPLSRCPITGEAVDHSFDPFGLDGLWWRYLGAARPPERLPATWFAFTGAMALRPPYEEMPFAAMPGPAAPYVAPRLFRDPAVIAVVSSVAVGRHQGFAIFYFARPMPSADRVNSWGANEYPVFGAKPGWGAVEDDPKEFDFDLARWMAQGRLRWIAPGDTSLALRDGAAGCPYVGLTGTRDLQWVQRGSVS